MEFSYLQPAFVEMVWPLQLCIHREKPEIQYYYTCIDLLTFKLNETLGQSSLQRSAQVSNVLVIQKQEHYSDEP
jgi:hypothetical protein